MIDRPGVLVTGAGGFLGGWLAAALVERGQHVIGLDRIFAESSMAKSLGSAMDFVVADIEDYDLVLSVLQTHNVQVIYHLAAQAFVGIAARDPLSTFRSNVEGTWNILEAARLLRSKSDSLRAIIVASSDKAYGDQAELPYTEGAPMEGRFPYDVSKSCTDLIARAYFHSYRLPVCVTRCGNLYGGWDLAFSRIIPGTIRSVLMGQSPVIRSDGTPVRDYVYVQDAIQAIVELSDRMLVDQTVLGEAFNISNESPVSVLQLVERILGLMERHDLTPIIQSHAPLEIQAQYLSSKKLHEKLHWQAKFDLNRGLLETIAWYRARLSSPAHVRQSQLIDDER